MDLTAVICTRDRAHYLDACVQSLVRQPLPRERYEILVVDNGSTDGTAELCRPLVDAGVIRYEMEPVTGLSAARNCGWRNARGVVVAYLDDDATACESWAAAALDCFATAHPAPVWVGGPIDLDWEAPSPEWISSDMRVALGEVDWGDQPHALAPGERLGGGNSFFLRRELEGRGGFDTRLGRKHKCLLSGEETKLQLQIQADGGILYYHPDVRIRHHVPTQRLQPSFFYRRYYWGGFTDAVIRRSLAPSSQASSLAGGDATRGGRWRRAARHGWNSLGLGVARRARIQGRIYLAYVLGVASGARWCRRHGVAPGETSWT